MADGNDNAGGLGFLFKSLGLDPAIVQQLGADVTTFLQVRGDQLDRIEEMLKKLTGVS